MKFGGRTIGFMPYTGEGAGLASFCLETLSNGRCAVTDRAYSVDSATVGAVYDRPGKRYQNSSFSANWICRERAEPVQVSGPAVESGASPFAVPAKTWRAVEFRAKLG